MMATGIKEKPIIFSTEMVRAILDGQKTQTRRVIKPQSPSHTENRTPYPLGTILWVKEAWLKNENPESKNYGKYEYKADYKGTHCQDLISWKSSLFMPRAVARLFLLITDVRAERLQEITEEDAKAEGIRWTKEGPLHAHLYDAELDAYLNFPTAKEAFKYLWDGIYGKKYPWESNPWVWVYSFMRRKDYGRNKI